ncbi:MAG TPA: rhomboid family intramembrane serine protease [Acidobacteriaceae bacterium]|nr:rhomboid family intramembrane serine protease [Acidobacteriaceae bacterium]
MSHSPAPEIRPPDSTASSQSGETPRPQRQGWAYAPATYILIAINTLVLVAMALNHVSLFKPTGAQLLHWGATHPYAILYLGQWWRIITAMFVHVGIIHLATNMWCLWNLGLLGEPLLGPLGIVAAYILAGAAGNLLSIGIAMATHTEGSVGAGASGAVLGIAGALIVLLKSPALLKRHNTPEDRKEIGNLRRSIIYFAAITFVIGFGGNQFNGYVNLNVRVDNWAHVGGLIGGILFALPLLPRPGSEKRDFLFRRRLAIGLMTCLLIFLGVYLTAVFPAPALPMQQ